MALPPRPRPFAERPQSVLPSPGPANDNRQEARDQANLGRGRHGRLQGHAFRFASPEAEEQWIRNAYQAGINADTWHLGDEIDDRTAELALAGLGGPMPAVYLGPDGKYRTINPRTIEAAAVRDHRNRHLTGKTIDQIATAGKMPGEEEWIARWRASRAANDNKLSRGSAGQKEESPSQDEGADRPDLGTRFAASARRAVVDDTVFGNALQQFASGHAVSPDVLATRPSDRFLQLGSKGMLEWHRMFEPLGIAGGKRRIDFLSPQERKRWETAWEALPASQQAAYRAMWEEKQKDYRPWRDKFERETALPPPESVAEFATDIAGSISGSMASPESWIGFLPKTPLHTMRAAATKTAKVTALNAGESSGLSGRTSLTRTSTEVADQPAVADASKTLARNATEELESIPKSSGVPTDLSAEISRLLPNENTEFLTKSEALRLPSENRGVVYVLEAEPHLPHAAWYQAETPGAVWSVKHRKPANPGLRYDNPDGENLIKFDGAVADEDGIHLVLIDSKTAMAPEPGIDRVDDTLERIFRALDQNNASSRVKYKADYHFPTEREAARARQIVARLGREGIVTIHVRLATTLGQKLFRKLRER